MCYDRIVNAKTPGGNGSHAPLSSDKAKQGPPSWETVFCVGLFFASLVAAVMLWKAIGGKHPYAFYTALRWVCFSVFFCSVIAIFRMTYEPSEDWLWAALFRAFGAFPGALAVLFNPFFEFHFRRETWRVIDIVSLVLMILICLGFAANLPAILKKLLGVLAWSVSGVAAGIIVLLWSIDDVEVKWTGPKTFARVVETFQADPDHDAAAGYEFTVHGRQFTGSATNYELSKGDRLEIQYSRRNPEHNRALEDTLPSGSVIFLIVLGCFSYYATSRNLPNLYHLLCAGKFPHTGRVYVTQGSLPDGFEYTRLGKVTAYCDPADTPFFRKLASPAQDREANMVVRVQHTRLRRFGEPCDKLSGEAIWVSDRILRGMHVRLSDPDSNESHFFADNEMRGLACMLKTFSDKVGQSNRVILRESCKLADLHFLP